MAVIAGKSIRKRSDPRNSNVVRLKDADVTID